MVIFVILLFFQRQVILKAKNGCSNAVASFFNFSRNLGSFANGKHNTGSSSQFFGTFWGSFFFLQISLITLIFVSYILLNLYILSFVLKKHNVSTVKWKALLFKRKWNKLALLC